MPEPPILAGPTAVLLWTFSQVRQGFEHRHLPSLAKSDEIHLLNWETLSFRQHRGGIGTRTHGPLLAKPPRPDNDEP